MNAASVLGGSAKWAIDTADCVDWLAAMPDKSIDLLFTSPPYEDARTYGIGVNIKGQDWVDWMVRVVETAMPKVKGLMAIVCEGRTRDYRWSAVPSLLEADLHRKGFCLRSPVTYHRVGIPGSGGPDWLRRDTERIVCLTHPGRLPWSDVTACGHEPKHPVGGAMSNRHADGRRVNDQLRATDRVAAGRKPSGDRVRDGKYRAPIKSNPGNVIHCKVGGGLMGHKLAHENEAPFSLKLADFFVRSFCPPGGIVADCWGGSHTTGHAAIASGRRYVGCDLRASQTEIGRRRLLDVESQLNSGDDNTE